MHPITGVFINCEPGCTVNNKTITIVNGCEITTEGCPHCATSKIIGSTLACSASKTKHHEKNIILDIDTLTHEWGITNPTSWSPDTGC